MTELMEFEIPETENENTDSEKHLIFNLAGKLYSFKSACVSEIAILDKIYPLPLLPPYIPGIINRYSIPYAVFDTTLLLYNTPGKHNKVLVMKENIDRIAFIIDDVNGIVDIPKESIMDIETGTGSNDTAEAICASYEWNGNNVFVLDIQKILDKVTGDME